MNKREQILEAIEEWSNMGLKKNQAYLDGVFGNNPNLAPNNPVRIALKELRIGPKWAKYFVGSKNSMSIAGYVNLETGKIHGSAGPQPTKDVRGDVLDASTWEQCFNDLGWVRYSEKYTKGR